MFLKRIFITGILLTFFVHLNAQVDSVLLDVVKVEGSRINTFGQTIKTDVIHTAHLLSKKNLVDVVLANPSINIKQYGVSGLSTISFRGTGASHTSLMWNGMEINMLSTGLTDLNTINTSVFNAIEIRHGSSVALTENGSIGGSINLNSFDNSKDSTMIAMNTSIRQYQGSHFGLKSVLKKEKLTFGLNAAFSSGKNNIPLTRGIYDKLPNAESNTQNTIIKVQYLPTTKDVIELSGWYSNNYRQLPPSRFSASDSSFQIDQSLKLFTRYKHYFKQSKLTFNYLFDQTQLDYDNNKIDTSKTTNFVHQLSTNYSFDIKSLNVLLGLNSRFEKVNTNQYVEEAKRERHSFVTSLNKKSKNNKWYFESNHRILLWDQENIEYAANLGMHYNINTNYRLRLKASKDYKLPSFNDLYWPAQTFTMGNPDLMVEKSISAEMGMNGFNMINKNKLSYDLTAFGMLINDWIGWVPIEGVWTPINESKVRILGLESQIGYQLNLNGIGLDISLANTLTKNEVIDSEVESRVGSHQPYQPQSKTTANLALTIDDFRLNFNHQHVSKRLLYYQDEDSFLDDFHLGALSLSYTFKLKSNTKITIGTTVNNLYNTDYELQQGNPTLPRFFIADLHVEF